MTSLSEYTLFQGWVALLCRQNGSKSDRRAVSSVPVSVQTVTPYLCAANYSLHVRCAMWLGCCAGDVFHQVWCNRHPNEAKAYKKMGDVLAGDAFFSMRDGPKHSNQLVQLDIISLAAAAEAEAAGTGSTAAGSSAGTRGGVYSLQELEAAAAAAAADAAAQAVGLRVAQGALLATDLLGFAGIITWHEANEGLGLLRQQLACAMIEAAHPGLAEAAAAARPVLVETEEARYVMNPYNASESRARLLACRTAVVLAAMCSLVPARAVSVMLRCWDQHHPGTPKPYSTRLPACLHVCVLASYFEHLSAYCSVQRL